MKILSFLILLTTMLLANVGQITALKGKATLLRGSETLNVSTGFKLEEKDILSTLENSKAQIVFQDGTVITIGNKSELNIAEYLFDEQTPKNSKTNLKFFKGAFKSITGKIGKVAPERFQLATKTATIGIRGTTIVGDQQQVACTQGTITVSSNGVVQIVPAGMIVKTPKNAPPTTPKPYKAGSLALDSEDDQGNEKAKEDKASDEEKAKDDEASDEDKADEDEKSDEASDEDKADEDKAKEDKQSDEASDEDNADNDKGNEDKQSDEASDEENVDGDKAKDDEKADKPVDENNLDEDNADDENQDQALDDQDSNDQQTEEDGADNQSEMVNNEDNLEEEDGQTPADTQTQPSDNQENDQQATSGNANKAPIASDTPRGMPEADNAPTLDEPINAPIDAPIMDGAVAGDMPITDTPEFPMGDTPDLDMPFDSASLELDVDSFDIETPLIDVEIASIVETTAGVAVVAADVADTVTEIVQEQDTKEQADSTVEPVIDDTPQTILASDLVPDVLADVPSDTTLRSALDPQADAPIADYLDFGYWESTTLNESGVYATGVVTPSEIIDSLMIPTQATLNYTGGVAATVTDLSGASVESSGSIDLAVDFANKNITGNVKITEGNWQANINSGEITRYGISSTDISSSASSSVKDITGNLNGNFYGANAEAIGGNVDLSSATSGSVSGAYGAANVQP